MKRPAAGPKPRQEADPERVKPALIHEITSSHNPKYKTWLSLLEAKGIKREGLCVVSGTKILPELIVQRPELVVEVLLPPKAEPIAVDIRHTRLSAPLFKELDILGTKAALAVVRTPEVPKLDLITPPTDRCLVLALSDPSNLGACLRSAEAFGIDRVILTEECSSPFLPKCVRASSGSALRVKLFRTASSLKGLKLLGAVMGLDAGGKPIDKFAWPTKGYLVLGEEGQGLPAHLQATALSIPMKGGIESLNATVAASIALYSWALA